MHQQYILKKQIVSIFIVIILISILKIINFNKFILTTLFFYLLVIVSITFTPSLRRKRKYPIIIHDIIYHFPMILPIMCISIPERNINQRVSIYLGIILGVLLLISKYNDDKKYLSSDNPFFTSKIYLNEYLSVLTMNTAAILYEEAFYRYFVIGLLCNEVGWMSILISTLLFVHSHYINRWSNITFSFKSYIYHSITGIVFGCIFFYTGSILGCIIAHFLFNSHEYVLLHRRYKIKDDSKQLFNDYN